MKAKNDYSLPVKLTDLKGYSKVKSVAHKNELKHAIDFILDEGCPVYASAPGKVVFVKKDSVVGGNDLKYWLDGNRIVLKHSNGEYSAYEHLQGESIKVVKGDSVKQSELIALNGSTGFLGPLGAHLHFEVFTNPSKDESEGSTLQVSFKELKGKKLKRWKDLVRE